MNSNTAAIDSIKHLIGAAFTSVAVINALNNFLGTQELLKRYQALSTAWKVRCHRAKDEGVANKSEHTAFAGAKVHLYASVLAAEDKATMKMVADDPSLLGHLVCTQAEELLRKKADICFRFVPGLSVGGAFSEGSLALTGLAVSQQEEAQQVVPYVPPPVEPALGPLPLEDQFQLLPFDRQVELLRNCHAQILREQGAEAYSNFAHNLHFAVTALIKSDSVVSAIARGDWRIVEQSDNMIMSAATKPSFLFGLPQSSSPMCSPSNYLVASVKSSSPVHQVVELSVTAPVAPLKSCSFVKQVIELSVTAPEPEAKSELQASVPDSLDALITQIVLPEPLGKIPVLCGLEDVIPKKITFSQEIVDTVHKVPAPSSPVTVAKLLAVPPTPQVEEIKDSPPQVPDGTLTFVDNEGDKHVIYKEELQQEKRDGAYMGSFAGTGYQAFLNSRYPDSSMRLVDFTVINMDGSEASVSWLYQTFRKHHDGCQQFFGIYCVASHWVAIGFCLNSNTMFYGDWDDGSNTDFVRPELMEKFKKTVVVPLMAYRDNVPVARKPDRKAKEQNTVSVSIQIQAKKMKTLRLISGKREKDDGNCGYYSLFCLEALLAYGLAQNYMNSHIQVGRQEIQRYKAKVFNYLEEYFVSNGAEQPKKMPRPLLPPSGDVTNDMVKRKMTVVSTLHFLAGYVPAGTTPAKDWVNQRVVTDDDCANSVVPYARGPSPALEVSEQSALGKRPAQFESPAPEKRAKPDVPLVGEEEKEVLEAAPKQVRFDKCQDLSKFDYKTSRFYSRAIKHDRQMREECLKSAVELINMTTKTTQTLTLAINMTKKMTPVLTTKDRPLAGVFTEEDIISLVTLVNGIVPGTFKIRFNKEGVYRVSLLDGLGRTYIDLKMAMDTSPYFQEAGMMSKQRE